MSSGALEALDELDASVRTARTVPLTLQVRIGREKVYGLLDRLRLELGRPPTEAARALDDLDVLVRNARSIPLTNEIRFSRVDFYDALDRLRLAPSTGDDTAW